jgi:hypothetical protein
MAGKKIALRLYEASSKLVIMITRRYFYDSGVKGFFLKKISNTFYILETICNQN